MIKKKISLNICFLEISEEICRTQKQVRISHGKRAIRIRAIEVRLCCNNYNVFNIKKNITLLISIYTLVNAE